MDAAPTDEDARRIVDLVVKAFDPLRIVLFGSLARGDEDPGDIDLMVVMPDGTDRVKVAQDLYLLIGREPDLTHAVDFVVATPSVLERFSNSVISVYPVILSEGRELYAA